MQNVCRMFATDVGVPVSACLCRYVFLSRPIALSLIAGYPKPSRFLDSRPTQTLQPHPGHLNCVIRISIPPSVMPLPRNCSPTYVRIQLANRCVTSPTETTSTQPPGRPIFLHSSACILNIYPWRHQPHLLEYCPNRTSTL